MKKYFQFIKENQEMKYLKTYQVFENDSLVNHHEMYLPKYPQVQFKTISGDIQGDYPDVQAKLDLLQKYIPFEKVKGTVEYGSCWPTDLTFQFEGKFKFKLVSVWNDKTDEEDASLILYDLENPDDPHPLEVVFNFHPFDGMGGLSTTQLAQEIKTKVLTNRWLQLAILSNYPSYFAKFKEWGVPLDDLIKERLPKLFHTSRTGIL